MSAVAPRQGLSFYVTQATACRCPSTACSHRCGVWRRPWADNISMAFQSGKEKMTHHFSLGQDVLCPSRIRSVFQCYLHTFLDISLIFLHVADIQPGLLPALPQLEGKGKGKGKQLKVDDALKVGCTRSHFGWWHAGSLNHCTSWYQLSF